VTHRRRRVTHHVGWMVRRRITRGWCHRTGDTDWARDRGTPRHIGMVMGIWWDGVRGRVHMRGSVRVLRGRLHGWWRRGRGLGVCGPRMLRDWYGFFALCRAWTARGRKVRFDTHADDLFARLSEELVFLTAEI
jgi:hypothetical protein